MAVEKVSGGTSLIDVLDRVLDKGIVIDAWVRVSLVGIDLITVEARIVVASIDTYLKYSEAVGQVADDGGIRAGIAGRVDGLLNMDDSRLHVGRDAFLLLLQATGQRIVRVRRRFRKEEVDDAKKLELLHGFAGEVGIRQGHQRVEADGKQPFDFAAVNGVHDFDRGVAGLRQIIRRDPPDSGYVRTRCGIGEASLTGQLVALLSVFATALTIALTGHHNRSGAFAANIAGSQRDGDYRLAILDTFGVVFQSTGMHEHGSP